MHGHMNVKVMMTSVYHWVLFIPLSLTMQALHTLSIEVLHCHQEVLKAH
jgi:hypothetical protein